MPPGMAGQLALRSADKQRKAVQQIDAPVGHDGPGDKRDRVFPAENQAADIGAGSGKMVDLTVAEKEQRPEQQ